jgi:cell division protein FtsB
MKYMTPMIILLLALAIGFFAVYGSESYAGLISLQRGLETQKWKNADAAEYVGKLKHQVLGLEHDERALEKAARNELGMAREDELIFIFEQKKKGH